VATQRKQFQVATERARSYCKSSKPQKDVGQKRGSRESDFDRRAGTRSAAEKYENVGTRRSSAHT